MKKHVLSLFILAISLSWLPVFSQTTSQAGSDTTILGLPGDGLDLFAVLNLFQKSKTIEDFEKSLNEEKTGINNLDLNLDNKVDFIKVTTKQKDQDFTFILQVDVTEKEVQDVAVILVSKDKNGKVTMQIVGDETLYGKGYVVEPKTEATPSVTPNPAYTGNQPVTTAVPASTTTVVVVESTPIVQYVYSPVYVPYYPPYYYHYYPPYFAAFTVMAVGVYHHNNYYHHGGYYGGHGNTVVIHNTNNYNNYNNSRNTSNTVNRNNTSGNYNKNNASARPSTGTSASNRPSTGTSASNRPSTGTSASARPSTGTSASARPSTGTSASAGQSAGSSSRSSSNMSSPSKSNYSSSSSRSSSSRSGGYSGGGGSRGGGGGRRR
jgi:uncharacterized membrane protein YgcG